MLKKYLKIQDPAVTKIEATTEEWSYYCTFTVMWEEIVLRLDKDWFYRNQQSQDDNIKDTVIIEEEKNRRRPNIIGEDGKRIDIPKEDMQAFKEFQLETRKSTMKRVSYVVDGINSVELYDKIHSLELCNFDDEIADPIDEVVSE